MSEESSSGEEIPHEELKELEERIQDRIQIHQLQRRGRIPRATQYAEQKKFWGNILNYSKGVDCTNITLETGYYDVDSFIVIEFDWFGKSEEFNLRDLKDVIVIFEEKERLELGDIERIEGCNFRIYDATLELMTDNHE
jgi:hypothetical protein